MKRTRLVLIAVILLILVGGSWRWMSRKETPVVAPATAVPPPIAAKPSQPARTVTAPTEVVPPPRTTNKEELHEWWLKMSKLDKNFEWRMPIVFFGKVIDDQNNPVPAAAVNAHWTDLSAKGSSERTLVTDAAGRFSLTGVSGKRLVVRIKKEGYSVYHNNRSSFEYAAYFEPEWHMPDPDNPVVFRLRRNREAEPLDARENQEAELAPRQSKSFAIGPNGAVVIVERLPNVSEGARGWVARVSVPGGGLVVTTEEFPFEAPESGYAPSLEITAQTPKPPLWPGDNGAALFVKTATGYGRITVRNTPGMAWVYVSSYFNPKSGSRNLEYDPSKAVKR